MRQLIPSLWNDFVLGNEDAFTTLYKSCYPELYDYGINLGFSDSEVKDCIQDMFLKLYAKPQMITESQTSKAFLFKALKNKLLNVYKKNVFSSPLQDNSYSFKFDYTIEDKLVEEEDRQQVKKKIDEMLSVLTTRQREIVYLRFFREMTFEEISLTMDITEQTARNLLSQSFQKIRDKGFTNTFILLILLFVNIPSSAS